MNKVFLVLILEVMQTMDGLMQITLLALATILIETE